MKSFHNSCLILFCHFFLQLTSYGGKLRATRRFLVRPGSNDQASEDIDVILIGKNGVSLYWIYGGLQSGQEAVRFFICFIFRFLSTFYTILCNF